MKGKVLALDYGRKMVGVASGDLETRLAFPREVLVNRGVNDLLEKVLALVAELDVVLVVLGMPSEENSICQDIVNLADLLRTRGVDVHFVNEDFSSIEAEQMVGGEFSGRLDANAAQVILQRFFNSYN